jgi:hypothetical protein
MNGKPPGAGQVNTPRGRRLVQLHYELATGRWFIRRPWLPQVVGIVLVAAVALSTAIFVGFGAAYDARLFILAALFGTVLLPLSAYWLKRAIRFRRAIVRAYRRDGIDLARR